MTGTPMLDIMRKELSTFLSRNPTANIVEEHGLPVVHKLWDDPTVSLQVYLDERELIDALNSVYLPPRFSALWHIDSKDFEVIYTAYKVEPAISTRSFEFIFNSRSYKCEFGDSSSRLMVIAKASRPAEAATETNHRNLPSYYMYAHGSKERPNSESAKTGKPLSFWIRNLDYEENVFIEFARRLNFYMAYFDANTPRIVVHQPQSLITSISPDPNLPSLSFPIAIRANPIDSYLLSLWESSVKATDPFRRFIYLYQILEYCAFYRVQEDVLRSVRRILIAPDTLSRVDDASREILEAVVDEKLPDPQKFVIGIERCVDPTRVWEQIEPRCEYFASDVSFDGGFRLSPLIKLG